MDNLNEIIVRIKADTSSFNNPIDAIRDEIPQFWRGNDIKFEIGIFNGENVWSVSNYASISLAIRKLTDDGKVPSASIPALMQKICTSLDDTLTAVTWENGTKQHVVISFSSAESNIIAGDHWLSIWATTIDATPKIITLCAGIIRILEVGGGNISMPPDPIKIYYTSNECDSRFIPLTAVDTNTNLGTSNSMIPSQKAVKTYVDQCSLSGSGEVTSASNLGTGMAIFKEKVDGDLKFKTLKGGGNVAISSNAFEITISSSETGSDSGEKMTNPMTTEGDLIIGGESGTAMRLGKGSNGQVLKSTTNGVEWANEDASYVLPTASESTLGGIKVGNNLTIANGVLSANDQTYSLPIATISSLGGIIPDGTTITVDSTTGVVTASAASPVAPDCWAPTDTFVKITAGSSGDIYNAPADGWIYVKGTTSYTNGYLLAEVSTPNYVLVYGSGTISYSSNQDIHLFFPVRNGGQFQVYWEYASITN
ncbi:MAG: hypothetical protein LBB16_00410 [Puniceicoccales bacterium]|jgi:hypothetical protein|nr:hypothetical protein [Puniceicoccales bacterium]